MVCPKLVRIKVVNHLFSGIDAAVNANAIGGYVLVVKGSARPGRVAIIGLSALYPNLIVRANINRIFLRCLDGREIQLIFERIDAVVVSKVCIFVGRFV